MDRLKELKRNPVPSEDNDIESDRVGLVTNGANSSKSPAQQGKDNMQEFFSDVEIVKTSIAAIKDATRKISDINQNVVQATTVEREQDQSSELEPIIKQTNKKATLAKGLLQRLKEETDRTKASGNQKSPEVRIRENMVSTLTRKFIDVMKEYQNAQTKFKTDIKKKVKRQVQIVKPDATTEEIDAVFRAGGGSGEFVKTAILTNQPADAIRNAYMNVADKYQDVLVLEASVQELHQMFLDFATLVEKQGELLDQIETQVKEASDYIDQGNEEMVQAIELQKSIRRKQCCIAMIVLVVIGIIVAIIAAKVSGGL